MTRSAPRSRALYLTLPILITLTGCSDPYAMERQEFVRGCAINSPEAVCNCAFDKLADELGEKEIKAVAKHEATFDVNLLTSATDAIHGCRQKSN